MATVLNPPLWFTFHPQKYKDMMHKFKADTFEDQKDAASSILSMLKISLGKNQRSPLCTEFDTREIAIDMSDTIKMMDVWRITGIIEVTANQVIVYPRVLDLFARSQVIIYY